MSGGAGYALAPKALAALAVAGFLIFAGIGFLAARPAEPAAAPDNSAPAPKPVGGVEPPTLDEAAAVPVLAHKRPPAVLRRARWRREGESFDRAQRSARLAVRRAAAPPAGSETPAPFDDGGVPDSGEFDYEDGS